MSTIVKSTATPVGGNGTGPSPGGDSYVLPGPNLRRDAEKRVTYLTESEVTAAGRGSSLAGLPVAGLCLGTEALVRVYRQAGQADRPNVRLRLVPAQVSGVGQGEDGSSTPVGLQVCADGNFTGPLVAAEWVEADSPAEAAAALRRWEAGISDWKADETIKHRFAGDTSDSFFTVLSAGGPFPAPVKNTLTTYYRPAGAPPAPVGFTPADARLAQLNRVAPAGTTTVTLTAESPTDYGTATSGSFTVDATNCVVGKVVRFAVAASGSAPAFTAAPAGQPYKQLGVSYASGHAYTYSLLVCVDMIEVVCAPND